MDALPSFNLPGATRPGEKLGPGGLSEFIERQDEKKRISERKRKNKFGKGKEDKSRDLFYVLFNA